MLQKKNIIGIALGVLVLVGVIIYVANHNEASNTNNDDLSTPLISHEVVFKVKVFRDSENAKASQQTALNKAHENNEISESYSGMRFGNVEADVQYSGLNDYNRDGVTLNPLDLVFTSLYALADLSEQALVKANNFDSRTQVVSDDVDTAGRLYKKSLTPLKEVFTVFSGKNNFYSKIIHHGIPWYVNAYETGVFPVLIDWDGQSTDHISLPIRMINYQGKVVDWRKIAITICRKTVHGRVVQNLYICLSLNNRSKEWMIYGIRDMAYTVANKGKMTIDGFTGYPATLSIQSDPFTDLQGGEKSLRSLGVTNKKQRTLCFKGK